MLIFKQSILLSAIKVDYTDNFVFIVIALVGKSVIGEEIILLWIQWNKQWPSKNPEITNKHFKIIK